MVEPIFIFDHGPRFICLVGAHPGTLNQLKRRAPKSACLKCHPVKNAWKKVEIDKITDYLVVEPTHWKNMRKSNRIISPGIGVKIKNI